MGEVRTLPGVTAPDVPRELQPVAALIEDLEELLADARSGRLRAIAVASVHIGDEVGTRWCRPPSGEHGHALAAAIGNLFHRYHADRLDCSRAAGPDLA